MSVAKTRAELFPATESVVYLNTGSAGPLLQPVADSLTRGIAHELSHGRADATSWKAFLEGRQGLRNTLADLVGAGGDEIALTHHTTEGLNIVLWGLDWKVGDTLAISSLEHDAGIAAAHTAARRFGLNVVVADCGAGSNDEVLDGIARALVHQPRVLLVSHVTWSTGAVLPLAQITELAHESGTAVLVDGAQAVGNVKVDFAESGVDFYSFNGYKWLCGPEGSGALVVRRDWHERLTPSFGGAFAVEFHSLKVGDVNGMRFLAGAERYESGSWFRPQLDALKIAADWFTAETRAGRGPAHISKLAALCAHRLQSELGARVSTPANPELSGFVSFRIDGIDSAEAVGELEQRGIIVRSIPTTGDLRVSCAAFTTTDDIDAFIAALSELRTSAN